MIEKDGCGGSTGKDKELDALLSAADRGMLDAIRDNVDLDTGFAQIVDNLADTTPPGQPAEPAEADPDGHASSYGHAFDPVDAYEVSSAAHRTPATADPRGNRDPLYRRGALVTLALALVAALNIAVLFSLSQNHGMASAQPGANVTNPPSEPISGRPAGNFHFSPPPKMQQLIVLANKPGASASLRFAADSVGIGGDPVISYLRDSRSGPVLLLSGLPAGTATRFLSIDADQSCRNCSTVSYWKYPFPSGGEQFSPGTTIYIAGANGRVILRTIQNHSSGQVIVIITWLPDLA